MTSHEVLHWRIVRFGEDELVDFGKLQYICEIFASRTTCLYFALGWMDTLTLLEKLHLHFCGFFELSNLHKLKHL